MPRRYAHVIPAIRTPFGVNGFDYLIPEALTEIDVGHVVLIPFRRRTLVGLIASISSTSAYAEKVKPLTGTYASLVFPRALIELLQWTAKRTFTSEPTVLAAWLRHMPKRPATSDLRTIPSSPKRGTGNSIPLNATWTTQPSDMLIKTATEHLRKKRRTLIIVPWMSRVRAYHARLPAAQILHSDMNDGDAFRAWTTFIRTPGSCLITTRLGAWLAPFADRILLDEPENDDHKQDELAPRYDARLLLVRCARETSIPVESFGLTPPLHVEQAAPEILLDVLVHPRRPGSRSSIPCIQADSLHQLREHNGPRIIYHPVRGIAARLVCRDCGWRASCPSCSFELSPEPTRARCHQCGSISALPEICPNCQGADLGKSTPGIERLKTLWQTHEPNTPVEWRNLGNEDVDATIPDGAMVLVTDATLLGGAVEDVRRRERTCVAYRRLADRVAAHRGTLIIQCPESVDPITQHPQIPPHWHDWLHSDGFNAFRMQERNDRALFNYPPTIRLAKCLIDGDETTALAWEKRAREVLPKTVSLRGPFFVPFRPASRSMRHVWHLLFPPETTEDVLIRSLTPLASSAIIDLDPIAYFK